MAVQTFDALGSMRTKDKETVTLEHPGTDLMELATNMQQDRAVFSEYYAIGAKSAAYMLCKGRYKPIFHSDYAPQFFDLGSDSMELND